MEIDRELLLESFLEETGELLSEMEQALLALEERPRQEVLHTIFRCAHTLKSLGASLGFSVLNPEWVARVRVWSTACSTGEEPYSVAMTLLAHLPASSGWEVEVVATDLYFGAEARESALQALLRRLPPTGHLFLGHAESITHSTAPVRCVAPNIYRRTQAPLPPRPESTP